MSDVVPRNQSKVNWHSGLPKGNAHTTPEKAGEREAKKRNAAEAEQEFQASRKILQRVLDRDPAAIERVWEQAIDRASEGHYKFAELVLGYAFGRPVATQQTFAHELTGDDLFDATESVGRELGLEGWSVIEGGAGDDGAAEGFVDV